MLTPQIRFPGLPPLIVKEYAFCTFHGNDDNYNNDDNCQKVVVDYIEGMRGIRESQ